MLWKCFSGAALFVNDGTGAVQSFKYMEEVCLLKRTG